MLVLYKSTPAIVSKSGLWLAYRPYFCREAHGVPPTHHTRVILACQYSLHASIFPAWPESKPFIDEDASPGLRGWELGRLRWIRWGLLLLGTDTVEAGYRPWGKLGCSSKYLQRATMLIKIHRLLRFETWSLYDRTVCPYRTLHETPRYPMETKRFTVFVSRTVAPYKGRHRFMLFACISEQRTIMPTNKTANGKNASIEVPYLSQNTALLHVRKQLT